MTLVLLTPLVTQAKTVSKGHKTTTAATTIQLKKKSKKKSKHSTTIRKKSRKNSTTIRKKSKKKSKNSRKKVQEEVKAFQHIPNTQDNKNTIQHLPKRIKQKI